MEENFYIDYFKALAEKHLEVAHVDGEHESFFVIDDVEMDMREVQEAVRNRLKLPAFLLEMFDDDLTDNNNDNNTEILYGAFAVVIRANAKDVKDIRRARREARAIAKDFVFKMKGDGRSGELEQKSVIVNIESKGLPVGPIADGCYGWRYSFTWRTWMDASVKANKWKA